MKRYMQKMHFDQAELESRRSYFQLTDEDLARLVALRPLAKKYNDEVVEEFYRLLLSHAGSRAFFPDEATLQRAKSAQKRYFLELFDGRCDLTYVENRLRVGTTHERMGLQPRWYLGAYAHYMRAIDRLMLPEIANFDERLQARHSIQKIVFFDMSVAIEVYIAAGLDTAARHQQALRELSTPVIRIFERVLLLPLIGTIDTQRAQQVMESLLVKVSAEKAKAVIIDIAGVGVVDTKVADYLLQATGAVRLLGCETILTGISPQVARTIIQLGVDISAMHTLSRLEDGIELALSMVGKQIAPETR